MPPKQAPFKRQAPRQSAYQQRRLLQSNVQAHLSHNCNNYIWVPKDKVAATTYDAPKTIYKASVKACSMSAMDTQNLVAGTKLLQGKQVHLGSKNYQL